MREIYRSIINKSDPETLHNFVKNGLNLLEYSRATLSVLESLSGGKIDPAEEKRLNVNLSGVEFKNPLLVAAGWTKEGQAVEALTKLGFGSVVVGTVTEHPQEGNPRPRVSPVSHGVIYNHMGFPGPGMQVVAGNLEKYKDKKIPIGISIGKNKKVPNFESPQVYAKILNRLYDSGSYFEINISSPNTPGLRELQDKWLLTDIIQYCKSVTKDKNPKPLFVKVSPDLNFAQLEEIIKVVFDNGGSGLVIANTTNNSEIKSKYSRGGSPGGISGDDIEYRKLVTKLVKHTARITDGTMGIIAVGGIHNTETAIAMLTSGATLLEIFTAIRSEGLGVAGKINNGILDYMDKYGFNNVTELVGINVK